MKITNFGTTTLLFDDGESQILFDAHFTRPSVAKFLFKKVSSDKKLINEMMQKHHIDRLKAIFVSHSHYDHVMDAPYIVKKTGATLYGSMTTKNIALGAGVHVSKMITFEDDHPYKIGDFKITIIPSIHSKPNVFNNDLGEEIEKPLENTHDLTLYKEGGSFDFFIEHKDQTYLIHPSCNYIKGRLKGYKVDVLYLALAGITKMEEKNKNEFFDETIKATGAKLVIPIHWDNFFKPLDEPPKTMPKIAKRTDEVFFELINYCEEHQVDTIVQLPRTSIHI